MKKASIRSVIFGVWTEILFLTSGSTCVAVGSISTELVKRFGELVLIINYKE